MTLKHRWKRDRLSGGRPPAAEAGATETAQRDPPVRPPDLTRFSACSQLGSWGKRQLCNALVLLDPGKYKAKSRPPTSPAGEGSGSPPAWQIGEQEFEALMRMLDNLVRMWPPLHGKAFILQHECCFHFLNFFPFLRLHP